MNAGVYRLRKHRISIPTFSDLATPTLTSRKMASISRIAHCESPESGKSKQKSTLLLKS